MKSTLITITAITITIAWSRLAAGVEACEGQYLEEGYGFSVLSDTSVPEYASVWIGKVFTGPSISKSVGTVSVVSAKDGLAVTAAHVYTSNLADINSGKLFLEFPKLDKGVRFEAEPIFLFDSSSSSQTNKNNEPRDIALLHIKDFPHAYGSLEIFPGKIGDYDRYVYLRFGEFENVFSDIEMPSGNGKCTYLFPSSTASGDSGGAVINMKGGISGVIVQKVRKSSSGIFVPMECVASKFIDKIFIENAVDAKGFESEYIADQVVDVLTDPNVRPPYAGLDPSIDRKSARIPWISNLDLMRFVQEITRKPSSASGSRSSQALNLSGSLPSAARCHLSRAIISRLGSRYAELFIRWDIANTHENIRVQPEPGYPRLPHETRQKAVDADTQDAATEGIIYNTNGDLSIPHVSNERNSLESTDVGIESQLPSDHLGHDEVEKVDPDQEVSLPDRNVGRRLLALILEARENGDVQPSRDETAFRTVIKYFKEAEAEYLASQDTSQELGIARAENLLDLSLVGRELALLTDDYALAVTSMENARRAQDIVVPFVDNRDIVVSSKSLFASASAVAENLQQKVQVAEADPSLEELIGDPANWAMQSGNYANTRYSELDEITSKNVGELRPAWTFSTGVLRGHEGGPLIIDDTMYVHTPFPNRVFAIDLKEEGRILWMYEPTQDPSVIPVMCCDTVNRGVAYGHGNIFLHQADTTLVALNAESGEVEWSTKNGYPDKGETGTSAPLVVGDKVFLGISGGEFGVQGHLTAYNIADGSRVWRAYSTGPDNQTLMDPENTMHLGEPVGVDSGTATWDGDQWKIGGGTTWGWLSYDPEENLIYYGTGNPSTWNPVQRPGDNRWSMSIFARDADTGVARWVYQMTPHDEWDYDGVNEMILVDQEMEGKMRKTLVHFDRNGFGYTLDRVTGELLVAEKFDPAVNWATHVDMETGRPQVVAEYSTDQNGEDVNTTNICPASLGSKDQQPAAYSPKTKLFYVPTNHVCMDYEPFEVEYTAGQPYVGATLSMYPAGRVTEDGTDNLGNFIAWDATTGKIKWSKSEAFSIWSGALATAGDVVFYGTLEGYLKAVDAYTGEELYSFKTPSGIIGNVTTWEHDGKQYIGVLSGLGGWAGIGFAAGLTGDTDGLGAVGAYKSLSSYTSLGGVLTVFSL